MKGLTLKEAACKCFVSTQALYNAIRNKKLKASYFKHKWYVQEVDLEHYRMNKHNREYSLFNGEPLYSAEKKEISVRQCAKLFGITDNMVYYLIYRRKIPSFKKGGAHILMYDDCINYFTKKDEKQLELING